MNAKGIGEDGEGQLVVRGEDVGDRGCHLTLAGELDMASAPLVRQAVDDAVARGRTEVTIDAARVTFIDSSALVVILTARSDLAESGGTVHLTNASAPVTRILEIAMLTDLLIDRSGDEP